MVRMTVTVDEKLLKTAKKLSRARTKRETIELALRELIRRYRKQGIAAHSGKIELGLTQEDLRRLREEC